MRFRILTSLLFKDLVQNKVATLFVSSYNFWVDDLLNALLGKLIQLLPVGAHVK